MMLNRYGIRDAFPGIRVLVPGAVVLCTDVFDQFVDDNRLADPALYRGAPEEVRTLRERLAALDEEIAKAMLRWEELESRSAGLG